MITVYTSAGIPVSTSKNLRGIIDRNRRDPAVKVTVSPRNSGRAELFVRWSNGDWACSFFESYDIAVAFAQNKRFAGAKIDVLVRQILGTAK